MADIAQLLSEAQTVEERAIILREELAGKRESVERLNGGLILDIEEYEGLQIGDKVGYTDVLGKSRDGYISHFFTRKQQDVLPLRMVALHQHLVGVEEKSYDSQQQIIPIIIPIDGFGYSSHHRGGLPKKIN
jgi:hypothetical protein